MANGLYDAARASFLTGGIAIATDSIKAILVDTGAYTVDLATHDFLNDVPTAARIATSAALGTKTTTAGVFDAADVTFSSVSGTSVEAIILYDDTPATEATKNLICYIDTATGLPVTPNGGDITVQWDSGANKIFKL